MKIADSVVRWFVTEFYPRRRIVTATRYEEVIVPRLGDKAINFFSPWGPRYKWQVRGTTIKDGDPEVQTLSFLADLFIEMRGQMPAKKLSWIFLGADLYGTRINTLPTNVVADYFASLQNWLKNLIPEAEFVLWSDLDALAMSYRERARANLGELIGPNVRFRANRTAAMMKGSADEYLVERLAEAMLIEDLCHPIKISLVPKSKDAEVDHHLPRLYILPEELQAPWL